MAKKIGIIVLLCFSLCVGGVSAFAMVQKPLHGFSQRPPRSAEKDGEHSGVLPKVPGLLPAV